MSNLRRKLWSQKLVQDGISSQNNPKRANSTGGRRGGGFSAEKYAAVSGMCNMTGCYSFHIFRNLGACQWQIKPLESFNKTDSEEYCSRFVWRAHHVSSKWDKWAGFCQIPAKNRRIWKASKEHVDLVQIVKLLLSSFFFRNSLINLYSLKTFPFMSETVWQWALIQDALLTWCAVLTYCPSQPSSPICCRSQMSAGINADSAYNEHTALRLTGNGR